MRQISRIDFVLLLTCLWFSSASIVQAQQPSRTPQRTAQAPVEQQRIPVQRAPALDTTAPKPTAKRPPAEEPAVEELPPELEKLLRRWEEESAKIKTLHGTQSRSEFNHVFGVEKVTKGPFFLETPDKGRIDMLTSKLAKAAVSKKLGKDGKPYALETDKSTVWVCTGDAILEINQDEKTYQRVEIPKEQRGSNIVHSPLPFLFGMKADEAKTRFTLKTLKETDEMAMLLVTPRLEQDRQNYKKAAIKLDKKKFLPIEVRMLDESDNEIVYTFESVTVNGRDLKEKIGAIFGMDRDPYHPSLKGYTAVLPNEPNAAPAGAQPVRPTVPAARDPRRPSTQSPAPQSATGPANGATRK